MWNFENVTVPKEQGEAFIGNPTEDMKGLLSMKEKVATWWHHYLLPKTNWRMLPVAVHMRCWNLAQHVLGPAVEKNLELFTVISLLKAQELTTSWFGGRRGIGELSDKQPYHGTSLILKNILIQSQRVFQSHLDFLQFKGLFKRAGGGRRGLIYHELHCHHVLRYHICHTIFNTRFWITWIVRTSRI